MSPPRLLTIAGSDSSGGAGIEADLKTFTAHGCYGMTCITGLTAQNTTGVKQIYPVQSQDMISDTLDAVFEDVGVDAVKTGMLTSDETVKTVVAKLKQYRPRCLVVDPVMISTSGAELMKKDAIGTYIKELFPMATVITPNLDEAKGIAEELSIACDVKNLEDIKQLAKNLREKIQCEAVLLKGGHAGLDNTDTIVEKNAKTVADILYNGEYTVFRGDFIDSRNTHGTGCTLASAIASNLAKSYRLDQAVRLAIDYVQHAISSAPAFGHGNGPVNHLHQMDVRPFAENRFLAYLLSHPKVVPFWDKYVNHPFTKQIAQGTVDKARFKNFLVQDYHYLRHYSRTHSLAGYKAHRFDTINSSAKIVQHIRHELDLHISYCEEFGLTERDLESLPESQACVAYSRFLIDVGHKEDWLGLQVALSPCLFGYLQAAELRHHESASQQQNNPYYRWVENYIADDYRQASKTGRELLERHVLSCSSQRLEELVDIFLTTTKMEIAFWDACM